MSIVFFLRNYVELRLHKRFDSSVFLVLLKRYDVAQCIPHYTNTQVFVL
jgi:hypothetical protein